MSLIRWDRVDRLQQGRTDKEIAKEAGFSGATLSNMRAGRPGFEARHLFGLARALGCSVAYLIGESDTPKIGMTGLSDEALAIAAQVDALPGRRQSEARRLITMLRQFDEEDQKVLLIELERLKRKRGEDVFEDFLGILNRVRDIDDTIGDGANEQ